jgi:hypothetical protein
MQLQVAVLKDCRGSQLQEVCTKEKGRGGVEFMGTGEASGLEGEHSMGRAMNRRYWTDGKQLALGSQPLSCELGSTL